MKRIFCLLTALACLMTTGNAFAEDSTAQKVACMAPVFDALTRNMGVEGEIGYAPGAPQFFWGTVYLAFTAGEHDAPTVEAPAADVREFSEAAFGDFGDMPDIPAAYDESIYYEPASDAYFMVTPDYDDGTYTAAECYGMGDDGRMVVTVGLYGYDGDRLGGVDFTIEESAKASQYPYVVKQAETEPEDDYEDQSACSLEATGWTDVVTYEFPLDTSSDEIWDYAMSQEGVVEELVNTYDENMGIYLYTFESVSPGETELTFFRAAPGADEASEKHVYRVTVEQDGTVLSEEIT